MNPFVPGVRLREARALCARLRVEYPRGVVVGGVIVGDGDVAVQALSETLRERRRRQSDGGGRRRVSRPARAAGSGRRALHGGGRLLRTLVISGAVWRSFQLDLNYLASF